MIDFAIIGFPKCATTSIQSNLSRSDKIEIIPGEPKPNEILRYKKTGNKLLGIKYPDIVYNWNSWSPLLNRSKLIVCWREPKDQLLTFYNYRKMEFEKNIEWTVDACNQFGNHLKDLSIHDIIMRDIDLFDCSVKKSKMELYMTQFINKMMMGEVLVINFSELSNPELFYRKIFAFLGVYPAQSALSNLTIENINHFKTPIELTEEENEKLETEFRETRVKMEYYTNLSQQILYNKLIQKKP